jgi:hypothetical protein
MLFWVVAFEYICYTPFERFYPGRGLSNPIYKIPKFIHKLHDYIAITRKKIIFKGKTYYFMSNT